MSSYSTATPVWPYCPWCKNQINNHHDDMYLQRHFASHLIEDYQRGLQSMGTSQENYDFVKHLDNFSSLKPKKEISGLKEFIKNKRKT